MHSIVCPAPLLPAVVAASVVCASAARAYRDRIASRVDDEEATDDAPPAVDIAPLPVDGFVAAVAGVRDAIV